MTHQTEPIRKSSLPTTPPREWEFHTVTGARTGTDGCALFPGDTGPVVVRRLVTYGDWEPVRPDRWADEPEPAAVSAAVAPPTDRAALRDRIAAALYERERPPLAPHWADALAADREVFQAMADAVLAELPEPTERAAAPVCRDEEGCHRVVPCDPGCGTRDLLAEATRPMPEPATRTIAEAALAAVETALGDTLLPDAREEALDRLMKVLPKPTDRSAVLADAESAIRTATGNCGYKAEDGCDFCNGVDAALDKLRRMADETATETPAVDQATVDRALDALRSGNHITARLLLESAMDPAAGARQDGAES